MWWDAMRSPAARWNHPKAVEKTVPWKPWKTKPRFPTAPTAPWKTRNLGEFPTFPPPCDSLFPSLKKTKGQEGSMKQADRSSVNKSGQIQKLPTGFELQAFELRSGRSGASLRQGERENICAGRHREVLLAVEGVAHGRGSPEVVRRESPEKFVGGRT